MTKFDLINSSLAVIAGESAARLCKSLPKFATYMFTRHNFNPQPHIATSSAMIQPRKATV